MSAPGGSPCLTVSSRPYVRTWLSRAEPKERTQSCHRASPPVLGRSRGGVSPIDETPIEMGQATMVADVSLPGGPANIMADLQNSAE